MASWLAMSDDAASATEDALVERVRRGDAAAFERVFAQHYAQVYRVAYNVVGSREEAEDLAQEAFLTLYRQPPAGGGASLLAWLCRVAINSGYNALRGQRRAERRAERLAEEPPQIDPHGELQRAEDRALVRAAIAELPEREGKLLLLRYAGLAYAEIAAAIGIAPASVGTLLARAERQFVATYVRLNPTDMHTDDTRTP